MLDAHMKTINNYPCIVIVVVNLSICYEDDVRVQQRKS